MYKIIGADGKEYGPVSLEQLKNWYAQKRISRLTKVQAEGNPAWQPAEQVPELAALFGITAPPMPTTAAPPLLTSLAPKQQSKGLAVTSFVLGLSSFALCLSALTGIPAIICGHVARRRIRRSPEKFAGLGFANAGITLGYVSIVFSIVLLSLISPRSSHRRPTFERTDCQNNLRQIGLAFKVWALEHNDQYPFNVSTNLGGSLELCDRGPDGFEKNPIPHLQVIAGDLSNPNFLVCPNDSSKHPAADFASLRPENVSYRLRTGTNINGDHPLEIMAICPIHGNELYCDGNVRKKPANPR